MADWKKLLVENPPASDIASSPSSGKVLKVSSNGTGLEWADDAGGAFTDNGSTATVTDRIVTITGSSSAIPTLDINPPSSASTASYSRIRVQTSGKDLRFNLRNGMSTSDVMTITHDSKVGIGTSSPSTSLEISGGTSKSLLVNSTSGTSTISAQKDGNYVKLGANGTSGFIKYGHTTTSTARDLIFFEGGGSETMRLTDAGRLGIGTTSPTNKLHINHNSSTSLGLYVAHSADEYGGLAKFYTNSSNNTARSLVEIHSDNATSSNIIPLKIIQDAGSTALHVVGEILTTGNFQVEKSYPDIMTKSNDEGRIGFMDAGGSIRSGMKNGGTGILKFIAGGNVERMRITTDGIVGINTTSPNSNSILHIVDGAGTMPTTHAGDSLIVQNNANTTDVSAIYAIAGTAGSSHIVFGDADSKNPGRVSYYHNSDYMSFHTSTTEQMRITSTGNVGIGTTSPLQPLHIESNNNNSDASVIIKNHNVDGTCGISFRSGSANNITMGIEKIGNNFAMNTGVGLGSGTRLLTVTTNGSVGIGTSSPSDRLHVADTGTDSDGRIRSSSQNVTSSIGSAEGDNRYFFAGAGLEIMTNTNHDIRFGTNVTAGNATPKMVLDTSGRLGIGTTSPQAKFVVAGDTTTWDGMAKMYLYDSNSNSNSRNWSVGNGGSGYGQLSFVVSNTKDGQPDDAGTAVAVMDGVNKRVGIGTLLPSEKLHVAGNILLPTNANSLSYKIRLKGDSTHEIYSSSYTLRYDANVGHQWNSAGGNTMTGGAGTIEFKHSTSQKYIRPGFAGFHLQASHDGGFGFVTVGSTSTYTAIEPVYTDNNTSGLKFNSRASGSTTERMRITSAGNVGIGETAPTQGLTLGSGKHLKLTGGIAYGIREFNRNANNQSTIILGGNGANANYDARIELYGQNANYGKAIFNYGYTNASKLQFQVLGNDKVVFSGNGSVGIGTSSPSAKFEVQPNNSSLTDNSALGLWIKGLNGGIKIGRHTGNDGAFSHIYTDSASSDHCYIRTYDTTNGGIATDVIGGADNNPINNQIKLQSYKQTHNILGTTVFVLDSNSRISLSNNDGGDNSNTIFGSLAGTSLASGGIYNTLIGANAGASITTSDKNVALGISAYRYGTGSNNVAIGSFSIYGSGSSDNNVAVGFESLRSLTTGDNNTAIGYQSLYSVTTGFANVGLGKEALKALVDGTMNIAIGSNALVSETGGDTTVAIGQTALYSQNVTSGVDSNNVGIGYLTSYYNVTGVANTAIGASALKGASGQSHSNNTAIGHSSLLAIETGDDNVAVGSGAGLSVTTGYDNSLLGKFAGKGLTTGDGNTLIGDGAGDEITTGRRNTVIGKGASTSGNDALDQIVIGRDATGVGDYKAIIGGSHITDVYMGDNGSSWSTTSDGRLKENIEEWTTGLDAINKLRIVEYNFKEDNPYKYDHKKKRQGIIAQEAIEAIPEMIKDDGEWLTANQEPMIWALVNAVQELTKKVNELETKLNKEN